MTKICRTSREMPQQSKASAKSWRRSWWLNKRRYIILQLEMYRKHFWWILVLKWRWDEFSGVSRRGMQMLSDEGKGVITHKQRVLQLVQGSREIFIRPMFDYFWIGAEERMKIFVCDIEQYRFSLRKKYYIYMYGWSAKLSYGVFFYIGAGLCSLYDWLPLGQIGYLSGPSQAFSTPQCCNAN